MNTFFVPAVGHLPIYFQKLLIPGFRPGGGGGGWALLELTDALLFTFNRKRRLNIFVLIFFRSFFAFQVLQVYKWNKYRVILDPRERGLDSSSIKFMPINLKKNVFLQPQEACVAGGCSRGVKGLAAKVFQPLPPHSSPASPPRLLTRANKTASFASRGITCFCHLLNFWIAPQVTHSRNRLHMGHVLMDCYMSTAVGKPVCDKRRLQTRRPADLQTCRPADLQTGLSQLILKTISCNLRRFPVTHFPLRTFKPWTGRAYFPTCF